MFCFQVFDFSLVLEGMPETWDQMLGGDLFSCGTLFETLPIKRRTMLTVYVHFSWSNVSSKHFSVHPCLSAINSFANLDPGTFHLLQITHKFPLQPRVCHVIITIISLNIRSNLFSFSLKTASWMLSVFHLFL